MYHKPDMNGLFDQFRRPILWAHWDNAPPSYRASFEQRMDLHAETLTRRKLSQVAQDFPLSHGMQD